MVGAATFYTAHVPSRRIFLVALGSGFIALFTGKTGRIFSLIASVSLVILLIRACRNPRDKIM
jgi:hypothetical protein